jgi:hypothetical protein
LSLNSSGQTIEYDELVKLFNIFVKNYGGSNGFYHNTKKHFVYNKNEYELRVYQNNNVSYPYYMVIVNHSSGDANIRLNVFMDKSIFAEKLFLEILRGLKKGGITKHDKELYKELFNEHKITKDNKIDSVYYNFLQNMKIIK